MAIAVLVAVVVGVLTEVLTGWVRSAMRAAARLVRRVTRPGDPRRDDHSTIHAGWIRVDAGRWPTVHAHVRCAPSISWAPRRMDRDGLYRLVQRVAPGVFPHEADYAVPDELIRFASVDEKAASADQVFACALPNGVLELSVSVPHRETDDGPVLCIEAVARIVGRFQAEVASGAFDRTFDASPARVDWFLNVSPSISHGDFEQGEWVDLDFPGRRPGGRASGMRPAIDVRGYGRTASQSISVAAPTDAVVRPLMTDFLERNGYRDITGAVDDIIDVTKASLATHS